MGKRRTRDTGRDPGGFVALPWSVLDSAAFMGLSYPAKALLLEVARQYHRDDNGRMILTDKYLRTRGWKSAHVIQRAKRELLEAGLIFETCMGQRPNRASWFAVTWRMLDRLSGYDFGVERAFVRGAYLLKSGAVVTAPAAVGKRPIAAPPAVGERPATAPGAAIRAISTPSSTAPRAVPLDLPLSGRRDGGGNGTGIDPGTLRCMERWAETVFLKRRSDESDVEFMVRIVPWHASYLEFKAHMPLIWEGIENDPKFLLDPEAAHR